MPVATDTVDRLRNSTRITTIIPITMTTRRRTAEAVAATAKEDESARRTTRVEVIKTPRSLPVRVSPLQADLQVEIPPPLPQ